MTHNEQTGFGARLRRFFKRGGDKSVSSSTDDQQRGQSSSNRSDADAVIVGQGGGAQPVDTSPGGDAHPPLPTFITPSQLTLLLRAPEDPELMSDAERINAELMANLPGLLKMHFGVETHEQLLADARGDNRQPVVFDNGPGRPLVLQTVNLSTWMSPEEFERHDQQPMAQALSDGVHRPGILEVGRALSGFRTRLVVLPPDASKTFWPEEIAPNWLAVPFCI
jgi:hypothetical protein